jgi:hypothetical protein
VQEIIPLSQQEVPPHLVQETGAAAQKMHNICPQLLLHVNTHPSQLRHLWSCGNSSTAEQLQRLRISEIFNPGITKSTNLRLASPPMKLAIAGIENVGCSQIKTLFFCI